MFGYLRRGLAILSSPNNLSIYGGTFNSVGGDLWQISYASDEQKRVAKWLSRIDQRITHNDIAKKRTEDTGSWFLESQSFDKWNTAPNDSERVLWCPGIPGVGKTVIASLAINYLRASEGDQAAVGFYYFNYKLQSQQSILTVLECLARQIYELSQGSRGAAAFEDLYNSHKKHNSRPTLDELRGVLMKGFQKFKYRYIILDALDEYLEHYSDKSIRELLETVMSLGAGIKVLVTSRVLGQMPDIFRQVDSLTEEIIANDGDMIKYLESRIASIGSCFNLSEALAQKVVQKVKDAAKGRFLMVELLMNSLAEQLNPGDLEDSLDNLPTGIDDTYARVMERIESYPGPRQDLARRALIWIAYTRRPLSVKELQHALATKKDRQSVEKYITSVSTITAVCAGLLVVQGKDAKTTDTNEGTVRFVHFTAQEFFGQHQSDYFPDANTEIVATSVSYLSLTSTSDVSFDDNVRTSGVLLKKFPFYDYIALNLGYHAKACTNDEVQGEITRFVQRNDITTYLCFKHILDKNLDDWFGTLNFHGSGIFLAIYYDQADIIPEMLRNLPESPTTFMERDPLIFASKIGRVDAVKAILEYLDSCSKESQTPIIDIRHSDRVGRTALSFAAANGVTASVKALLEHDSTLAKVADNGGRTPLSLAARHGHTATAKLLVDNPDTDVDMPDNKGRTPLSYAAQYGQAEVLELLLQQAGIDVNSTDTLGRTPLSFAAQGTSWKVIHDLLSHRDIDVNIRDSLGHTPLHYVAQSGNGDIAVPLLKQEGIDVNVQDTDGQTPLSYAAQHGNEGMVKLLLWHSHAQPDIKDINGWAPLCYAIQYGYKEVTGILLEREDVDVNAEDKDGRTPLSQAMMDQQPSLDQPWLEAQPDFVREPYVRAMVQLLLSRSDIDVNREDKDSHTALYYAHKRRWGSIVNLLERKGAVRH